MHLGQQPFIPRREDKWEPAGEVDMDEAKQMQSHLGEEEAPGTRKFFLVSDRKQIGQPPVLSKQS